MELNALKWQDEKDNEVAEIDMDKSFRLVEIDGIHFRLDHVKKRGIDGEYEAADFIVFRVCDEAGNCDSDLDTSYSNQGEVHWHADGTIDSVSAKIVYFD